MSTFDETLKRLQGRSERALSACLPEVRPPAARLKEAMRYASLNGGKRIRACLVYAGGAAVGAEDAALDAAACAVELVHTYSLIHDDLPCMDDDDLRRGKPTCHKAYDEATALLAGDALQALAFEVLLDPPDARRAAMAKCLSQAIGADGMAAGQAIDLAAVGQRLAEPALEDMHRRKTGALIEAAVLLGAEAASPLAPGVRAALSAYGRHIGLAFQIVDDVLDEEGEPHVLGKNPGADRARGKPTYPSILGLDAAKRRAHALRLAALESLRPLGDNARVLAQLADYIVERSQ